MFLFISGPEIFLVALIVVLFFGADKLPEIARGLGKGMRQIKDATNDIKKEITDSAQIDTSITKNVEKEIDKAKKDIEEITGSVKRNL